jgi:hypothetical protein
MPKTLKYAGIGPRQTPLEVCEGIVDIARQLDHLGWMVRSGYAQGADQAWEAGHVPAAREIYLPWDGFNAKSPDGRSYAVCPYTDELEAVAKMSHPYWDGLSNGGKKLMMRNVAIILGHDLGDPVQFVAYWSQQKQPQGGTGNAVRLASLYGIPSFNIGFVEDQTAMSDFVDAQLELNRKAA